MQLNEKQRERVSNILSDIGKIVFGGFVIGQFIPAFKAELSLSKCALGLILSITAWIYAIMFLKRKD